MRKIEKEVIGAFVKGDTKAMGNTESAVNPTTRDLDLLLHGNRIATMSNRDGVKKLWVSCGGYEKDVNGRKVLAPSRTTQSRLNALFRLWPKYMAARVYTKNHVQYLDSSRYGTVNLMALRKSAVLVYESFDTPLVDDGPINWPSFRDEFAGTSKPVRDALHQLLAEAGDYSEYLPRSKQTIH